MNPELKLNIFIIILWGAPILGGIFSVIAQYKLGQLENLIKPKISRSKKTKIKRKITIWKFMFWGAPILGLIIIPFASYQINQENEIKTSLHGTINSKEDIGDFKEVIVMLGSDSLQFLIDNNRQEINVNPFDVFSVDYPIKIKLINRKLSISAEIKSWDGKIISEIKDNEWVINPNNYFKRNYDDTGLEIIDQYNCPVLQLEMVNQNTIRLTGVFYTNNQLFIISRTKTIVIGVSIKNISAIIKTINLEEIFVYPSEEHFRERNLKTMQHEQLPR